MNSMKKLAAAVGTFLAGIAVLLISVLIEPFKEKPDRAFRGRFAFRDVAFPFRMGAGFAGDVNRTHPASIEPVLISTVAPPTIYGQPVLVDTTRNAVRPFTVGDTAVTEAYGFLVRPYPTQQSSASNFGAIGIGAATPPVSGACDVLKTGYILASVVGTPTKNGAVFVWCAASGGGHVQGGLETVASGGNTAALSTARYAFNGPPDANGIVEVIVRD